MTVINQHKVVPSTEAVDAIEVIAPMLPVGKHVYLDLCSKVPSLDYKGNPEDQRIKIECTSTRDHKVGRLFNKLPGGYYGPGAKGTTIATLIVAADVKPIKNTATAKKVVKIDADRNALDMQLCAFALKQAGGSFMRLKQAYNKNGGAVGKARDVARYHKGFSDRNIPTSYRNFVTAIFQGTIKL